MVAPWLTLVAGLRFAEAPRWHAGRLWFSDFFHHQVFSCDEAGALHSELHLSDHPSGLGWRPDGSMLVVAMHTRRLLAHDGKDPSGANVTVVADLSAHTGGHCNDLLVDAQGRAYVGNFGFDLYGGHAVQTTALLRVDPDGSVHVAAPDMTFPNGMALTPDGQTLVVAETHAQRLRAFDVMPDGSLKRPRVWADLHGAYPDGLCLDAAGHIWVADARGHRVLRVQENKGVVAQLNTPPDEQAYACTLGGADGKTLFVCMAPGIGPTQGARQLARIATVKVAVGAGQPPVGADSVGA